MGARCLVDAQQNRMEEPLAMDRNREEAMTDLTAILARLDALEARQTAKPGRVEIIVAKVAETYGVPLEALYSANRSATTATARMLAMYLIRHLTHRSTVEVGEIFEREHSTVVHACKTIRGLMETDPRFRALVEGVEAAL